MTRNKHYPGTSLDGTCKRECHGASETHGQVFLSQMQLQVIFKPNGNNHRYAQQYVRKKMQANCSVLSKASEIQRDAHKIIPRVFAKRQCSNGSLMCLQLRHTVRRSCVVQKHAACCINSRDCGIARGLHVVAVVVVGVGDVGEEVVVREC